MCCFELNIIYVRKYGHKNVWFFQVLLKYRSKVFTIHDGSKREDFNDRDMLY